MNSTRTDLPFPNERLHRAFEFLQYTGKSVFLTGKAGTGKTTFLHNLRKSCPKRMAVVAPTGVAAINAGGVTIHSFFQLPFGPWVPGRQGDAVARSRRFRKEKIELIRNLDVLVIDEISMVRADTLDGIDDVLRRFRDRGKPFGGLQLLMIGDLHQLAPITKDDERAILDPHYETLFFFGSHALQECAPVTIELTEVFRQSDAHFISLLNKVRTNQADYHTLEELNSRYDPRFVPPPDEDYITLTTHNHTARSINKAKLDSLDGEPATFEAAIHDDFPEHSFPGDRTLQLKAGAQVMFIKNDPSPDKLFYNGKIGRVVSLSENEVVVRCGDEEPIHVEPLTWENTRYSLGADHQVHEVVAGSFTQVPLRLAWAITIHKSQGLTFDKAIIDAQSSFAHGQVYVALSRCRTLEGMVLRSPISERSILTDDEVEAYSREAESNTPDEGALHAERHRYESEVLTDLFEFISALRMFDYLEGVLGEQKGKPGVTVPDHLDRWRTRYVEELLAPARQFETELNRLIQLAALPRESEPLQDRVRKAAAYFHDKLEPLRADVFEWSIETDNRAFEKRALDALGKLRNSLYVKSRCLDQTRRGFDALELVRVKTDAALDLDKELRKHASRASVAQGRADAGLLDVITRWRNETARGEGVKPYMVLPRKALAGIAESMPGNLTALLDVNGIGKARVGRYGEEILSLVQGYCRELGVHPNVPEENPEFEKENKTKNGKQLSRTDSNRVSFELFLAGHSIDEIAAARQLVRGTVEGHLAPFVSSGELEAEKLIGKQKLGRILDYIREHRKRTVGEVKAGMGEEAGYFEIRVALHHLAVNNEY